MLERNQLGWFLDLFKELMESIQEKVFECCSIGSWDPTYKILFWLFIWCRQSSTAFEKGADIGVLSIYIIIWFFTKFTKLHRKGEVNMLWKEMQSNEMTISQINLLSNICSFSFLLLTQFLLIIGCFNMTVQHKHFASWWWRQTAHLEKDAGFHEVSESDVVELPVQTVRPVNNWKRQMQ